MKCLACQGKRGYTTPSMLTGCPPHFDRCTRCDGTGIEPGHERDHDALVLEPA